MDIFGVAGVSYSASCGPCPTFADKTVALGPDRPDQAGRPWSDLVGNGTPHVTGGPR